MDQITVVIRPHGRDVNSLCYDANGVAIIGKNGVGEPYHLGQISSSEGWAKHDMIEHFKAEYDEIYPNGWNVVFDC